MVRAAFLVGFVAGDVEDFALVFGDGVREVVSASWEGW